MIKKPSKKAAKGDIQEIKYGIWARSELLRYEEWRRKYYSDFNKKPDIELNFPIAKQTDKYKPLNIFRPYWAWNWDINKEMIFNVANSRIKKFTQNGNFNHILEALRILGRNAFRCPVLDLILYDIRAKYSFALYLGDEELRKKAENYALKIGPALFDFQSISSFTKQNKNIVLLNRLQSLRPNPIHRKLRVKSRTIENVIIYIKKIYDQYKDQGLVNKKEIKLSRTRLFQIDAALKKYKRKQKKGIYQSIELSKLENEKVTLKSTISKLEREQEKIGIKEAKRKTINELYKLTDIRIGFRYLEDILRVAKTH